MFDAFLTMLGVLLDIVKIPLIIVAAFIGFMVLLLIINLCVLHFKGYRMNKNTVKSTYKRRGVFLRLFYDFPRQWADDIYSREADFFPYQGVIIFTGRQGRGKTVAMANAVMEIQDKCPLCKVTTNFGYSYEDKPLDHWRRLIDFKNGKLGVVACIDETQNWFSSNQSKNFPPEMLSVVTQNRKNRRVIFGTAQNFYLLAKALRSQCTEVRECMTLCGCVTFVRRREPILDCSGEVVKYKNKGFYFFVHSKRLRECYDTYRVVENLKHSGFQEIKSNV